MCAGDPAVCRADWLPSACPRSPASFAWLPGERANLRRRRIGPRARRLAVVALARRCFARPRLLLLSVGGLTLALARQSGRVAGRGGFLNQLRGGQYQPVLKCQRDRFSSVDNPELPENVLHMMPYRVAADIQP